MKILIYSGATRHKHLTQYAVVAITLFPVTSTEPPTASEDLLDVINTNEPAGRQKFAKVLPTGAQHLLLGFGQEQQEQVNLCRSDSKTHLTGDKDDMVGPRCTLEQRQKLACPSGSPGATGAGMRLSRAPRPGIQQEP